MLNEVADGVWVRQSEWVWSNSTVVRGDDGLILVDPGIHGAELDQLADDVERLGIPVVAVAAPASLVGGFLGARIATRIPSTPLRIFIVTFGVAVSIYLFLRV